MTARAEVKTKEVSDEELLEALRHSGGDRGRNGKLIMPWLYASADPMDSRKADFSRWFVTGPQSRRGYIKGPFPLAQIERVAAAAKLSVVCSEGGRPIAYELCDEPQDLRERRDALEAQLRHLTLPSQRGYRHRIERALAELADERNAPCPKCGGVTLEARRRGDFGIICPGHTPKTSPSMGGVND